MRCPTCVEITKLSLTCAYLEDMIQLNALHTLRVESNCVIFKFEPFEDASLLKDRHRHDSKMCGFGDFCANHSSSKRRGMPHKDT